MYIPSHSQSTQRLRGFSLIEVSIAMAIAALGAVTLLGLIPQGMDTMREAGDQAIRGRINQSILNELQMTPFDSNLTGSASPLDAYNGREFYYDAQGEELSDSKTQGGASEDRKKGSFAHVYSARVSVPNEAKKLPENVGGAVFGGYGFDGANSVNPYLRPVIVEVAPIGGRGADFDWEDSNNRAAITTYQSFVTKLGQNFKN